MESTLTDRSYRDVRHAAAACGSPRWSTRSRASTRWRRSARCARPGRVARAGRELPVRGALRGRRRRVPLPGRRPRHLLHRVAHVRGDGVRAVHARGRGDHGRLRRPPALGQAPLPDAPRRCAPRYPSGTASTPCASAWTPSGRFANDYVRRVLGPPVAAPHRGLSRLHERFPALRRRLPHLALGEGPTPVRGRPQAARAALWLKDDVALRRRLWGGNKVRKLEWILPDAKRRGKAHDPHLRGAGDQPRPGHRALRPRAGTALRDRAGGPARRRPRARAARAAARLAARRCTSPTPRRAPWSRCAVAAALATGRPTCCRPGGSSPRGRARLRRGGPGAGRAGAGGRAARAGARGGGHRLGRHRAPAWRSDWRWPVCARA